MPTFREDLEKHDLRIALYPELKGQVYVLECCVCGEATEIQAVQQILGFCSNCRLSWQQAAPKFWVLLPKSVPVPAEEE